MKILNSKIRFLISKRSWRYELNGKDLKFEKKFIFSKVASWIVEIEIIFNKSTKKTDEHA